MKYPKKNCQFAFRNHNKLHTTFELPFLDLNSTNSKYIDDATLTQLLIYIYNKMYINKQWNQYKQQKIY